MSRDRPEHGHYRDERQPTGACFYCPREDWRYPSAALHDMDMTLYCPGCGAPQDPTLELKEGLAP